MVDMKTLTINDTTYDITDDGAVRFDSAQELTEEQKAQARENIGAAAEEDVVGKDVKGLIIDILSNAVYTSNQRERITQLADLFGIQMYAIRIDDLFWGACSYTDGRLQVYAQGHYNYRLTLLPIGQYLQKGKTYKISLGNVSSTYDYGVQIFVATEEGLVFQPVEGADTYLDGVSGRLVDTGWMTQDYTYTANQDKLIICVNLRLKTNGEMSDNDKKTLLENFIIEEV